VADHGSYLRIGGWLGIIPALITFVGGWWYCATTYGFLLGFGLGWLPSLILAVLVELAFTLLWGPALAAVALFVIIPTLKQERQSEESAYSNEVGADPLAIVAAQTDQPWLDNPVADFPPDYSALSDEALLREYARQCGVATYQQMSKRELEAGLADCSSGDSEGPWNDY